MAMKQVIFGPSARLNHDEQILLQWFLQNVANEATILAEETQEGVKTADIVSGGKKFEFKTTSGNLNTLDTLLRRAAKQCDDGCAIVNLQNVTYSLSEAEQIAWRRMERSGLRETYLIHGNETAYLYLEN